MSTLEARLREYRAKKRREELVQKTKEKVEETKEKIAKGSSWVLKLLTPNFLKDSMEKQKKDDEVLLIDDEEEPEENNATLPAEIADTEPTSETSEVESFEEEKVEPLHYTIIKYTVYAVTWLTLYFFFLKLQFGAVFFVLSMLLGLYFNTRTRPKKKGEVSAYSVFNENCVSIDGTLKAEQFEREIMFGAGSVR